MLFVRNVDRWRMNSSGFKRPELPCCCWQWYPRNETKSLILFVAEENIIMFAYSTKYRVRLANIKNGTCVAPGNKCAARKRNWNKWAFRSRHGCVEQSLKFAKLQSGQFAQVRLLANDFKEAIRFCRLATLMVSMGSVWRHREWTHVSKKSCRILIWIVWKH